ncbi:MAG: hypothetical protein R3C14_11110 [Caldilineaceae bacterium]
MLKEVSGLNKETYLIIPLTLITAIIHIYLSFQFPDRPDLIFFLNGLGYLAWILALYSPIPRLAPYRMPLRWLFLAYTLLTILLWLFWGARTIIAYFDKVVEVALVAALWVEGQRSN